MCPGSNDGSFAFRVVVGCADPMKDVLKAKLKHLQHVQIDTLRSLLGICSFDYILAQAKRRLRSEHAEDALALLSRRLSWGLRSRQPRETNDEGVCISDGAVTAVATCATCCKDATERRKRAKAGRCEHVVALAEHFGERNIVLRSDQDLAAAEAERSADRADQRDSKATLTKFVNVVKKYPFSQEHQDVIQAQRNKKQVLPGVLVPEEVELSAEDRDFVLERIVAESWTQTCNGRPFLFFFFFFFFFFAMECYFFLF